MISISWLLAILSTTQKQIHYDLQYMSMHARLPSLTFLVLLGTITFWLLYLGIGSATCVLVLLPPGVTRTGGTVHGTLHQTKEGSTGSAWPIAAPNMLTVQIYFVVERMENLSGKRRHFLFYFHLQITSFKHTENENNTKIQYKD